MRRRKFASVTSGLLARKGEAAPWLPHASAAAETFNPAPENVPHANLAALKAAFGPPNMSPSAASDHPKRCTLALSREEYERLGIVAVKKGLSRHQVLRQAFESYMSAAAGEYDGHCECLAARDGETGG